MARRETTDVLTKARKVFATALRGLSDLGGTDPTRRVPGFHNVIVFGRATTFVLQNLRTIDANAFDTWYAPHLAEMKSDPLLLYFNKLRTELEKEGGAETGWAIHIASFDSSKDMANPPPGAKGFFIGDQHGGMGWHVTLPDGRSAKYYVQLPESQVRTSLTTRNPPTEHLGQPIPDNSAFGLSRLYLAYIDRLLRAAESHFGVKGG